MVIVGVVLLSFISTSSKDEDEDEDEDAVEISSTMGFAFLSASTDCPEDVDEVEGAVEVTVIVSSD